MHAVCCCLLIKLCIFYRFMERKSKTTHIRIPLIELFSGHTPHVSIVNDKKGVV